MGAALTYARRYALFTLVGIAGEDDLDAPDLCDGSLSPSRVDPFKPKDGQSRMPPRTPSNGDGRGGTKGERAVTLDPEQSAALREKLLVEVRTSVDVAAGWAREALTAKNSLWANDAKLVEDAFERRLSELSSPEAAAPSNDDSPLSQIAGPQANAPSDGPDPGRGNGIDKSTLTIAAPRRYRNKEQPSLRCPTSVSHLRPQTIRSTSSSLLATTGAWPQS